MHLFSFLCLFIAHGGLHLKHPSPSERSESHGHHRGELPEDGAGERLRQGRGAAAAASAQFLRRRLRPEAAAVRVRSDGAGGAGHEQSEQGLPDIPPAADPGLRLPRRQVSTLAGLHISVGCTCGHWFLQHRHHDRFLVRHLKPLSLSQNALPSHTLRCGDGRSDGFGDGRGLGGGVRGAEGELSRDVGQGVQPLRQVLLAHRQLRRPLLGGVHRPRLARCALHLLPLPS